MISSIPAELQSRFDAQRAGYLAAPEPDRAQRLADLKTLSRMISENRSAIVQAINADFGNRSEFETLFAEVFPAASRHSRRRTATAAAG